MKLFPLFPLAIALLFTCTCNRNSAVQSVPEISAIIYESDGITGADGAMVKVFNACDGSGEPVIVTITDDAGRFSLSALDDGIYNFWAEKDSSVLLQDSVPVALMQTTLHDDTLECASTLRGIVGLEDFHDPRSVTIGIAGFDRPLIMPDNEGRFTVKGLAAGRWSLLLRSTITEYLPTSAAFTVNACSDEAIDDTLRLYYTGIPVIAGITFTQDTLAGIVTISWEKPAYTMVRDYLVYRDACTSAHFAKEPAFITEDTFYVDSIRTGRSIDRNDTVPHCLSYRIAIRNTMQKVGATGRRIEIPFAPRTYVSTFFTHHVVYERDSCDSASVNDTVTIALTANNRTRPLRSIFWFDPATNDTVARTFNEDTLANELTDTLRYAFDSLGINRLVALVVDDDGVLWTDTIRVNVVRDTLIADAGNDTSYLSCDTIRFHGKATQKFGSIVQWAWKIASDYWIVTSGPDTAVIASTLSNWDPEAWSIPCSLAVIDENGNRAKDEVEIIVDVIPQPITEEIVAGGFHNLLRDGNNVLTGEGTNDSGQLGIKTIGTWMSLTPLMTDVRSMDAGDYHSLILTADGTVYASGANGYGQLGDGTFETRYEPVRTVSEVQQVAAGAGHSMILKTDGTLLACGHNDDGRLGDSTTLNRSTPVQVMTGVQSISAGGRHSLIVTTDGTLWACGSNTFGQLGDGTKENRLVPVVIMTDVRSAVAGGSHSLILKTDGSLWACGWNYAGQLGDNTTENRLTPVRVTTDVHDMAAGDFHSQILKSDGTVWAFGENGMGQLGDGTATDRLTPVKVMSDAKDVAAGKWHSLILQTSGVVWISGWTSYDADTYGGTGVVWQAGKGRLIPEER